MTRAGLVSYRLTSKAGCTEFEEKPLVTSKTLVSTGIYVIRRRQLIEMIERAGAEDGFDLVKDIFIRYKGIKKFMPIRWTPIGAM